MLQRLKTRHNIYRRQRIVKRFFWAFAKLPNPMPETPESALFFKTLESARMKTLKGEIFENEFWGENFCGTERGKELAFKE
jgi:hypothetical protein